MHRLRRIQFNELRNGGSHTVCPSPGPGYRGGEHDPHRTGEIASVQGDIVGQAAFLEGLVGLSLAA
jgi:hypothetical protein